MNDENVILCDNGCCVSDSDCFSGCECLMNVRCQWVAEYEVGCCFADAVPNSACDDGNPCTSDECDPLNGCVHELLDCDDGNACTIELGCIDGQSGPQCVQEELDCDDGLPCTLDSCDHLDGCKNEPFSDVPPRCLTTWPEVPYVPPNCAPDGDDCTWSVCDEVEGCVQVPPEDIGPYWCALTCEPDSNPCTDDYCNGVTCVHPNRPSGSSCHLGGVPNPCTVSECDGSGQCVVQSTLDDQPCPGLHDPPPPCKSRVCQNGACVLADVPNGTSCPNEVPSNPCTTDNCQDGVCVHEVLYPEDTCFGGWYGVCYVNTCELGYCAPEPRCDEYGGQCTVSECFNPYLGFVVPGSVTPENPEGVVHHVHGEPTPAPLADDRTFVTGSLVTATPAFWRTEIRTTRYAGPVDEALLAGPLEPAYREQAILARSLEPIALLNVHYFGLDCEQYSTCSDLHFLLWNNQPLFGKLLGECDGWSQVEIEVPIELVKFPEKPGVLGVPPTPAVNTLDVQFTSSSQCRRFAWASLSIRIMSPLILVHGNGSDSKFLERQGFVSELNRVSEGSIPCVWNGKAEDPEAHPLDSLRIDQDPKSKSILRNVEYLSERIPSIATALGVDSVHLVVHSKGGLDSRAYLAKHYQHMRAGFSGGARPPAVLSFSSLSTPHDGSTMAKLVEDTHVGLATAPSILHLSFEDISEVLAVGLLGAAYTYTPEQLEGNHDLRPDVCAAFNAKNIPDLPTDIRYWTYGGDADSLRQNEHVDAINGSDWDWPEYDGLPGEDKHLLRALTYLPVSEVAALVDALTYQPMRNFRSVHLRLSRGLVTSSVTVVAVPSHAPYLNDTLVTIESARGSVGAFADVVTVSGGGFLSLGWANHANISNERAARHVLRRARALDRSTGDLK